MIGCGGMMVVGGIFWLLVLAALVAGALYLLRSTTRGDGIRLGRGEALRILEERYARGDIDEREFREGRDVLRGGT